MAITFVGKSQNANDTTLSLPIPSGTPQTNDIIVAALLIFNSSGTASLPAGWTQRGTYSDAGDNIKIVVATHTYAAGDSAYSFTGTTTPVVIDAICVRGATETVDGSLAGATNSSGSCPSVTPTVAGDLLLCATANGATPPSSAPSGMTSLYLTDPTADGTGAAYQILAGTTSTGTESFGGIAVSGACVSVLFKASGGGGTSWNQSLADTQSSTDANTRASRKALADAHSALDALSKLYTSLQKDATSGTDNAVRFRSSLQTLTDATSGRDALGGKSISKSLGDATSALDALVRLYAMLRTDAFSLVDVLAKMPARTLLDWASSRDSINAFKASGVSWNQTLTDKHSALDVVARQVTKLTADQISALDTFAHTWVARLVLADLFSETDTQSKTLARTVSDTQVGQDVVSKLAQHSLQEAHSATDARTSLILHALAESLSATDVQTRSYSKGLFDALSQTDKLTAGRLLLLSLLDAFSLTDSAGQPQLAHPLAAAKIGMVASLVASLVGIQVSLQLGIGVSMTLSLLPSLVGANPAFLPSQLAMQTLLIPSPIGATATLL